MRLSPPKQVTLLASLILAILGIVSNQVVIPVVSEYSFWLVIAGFVMLLLGTLFRGF